MSQTEIVRNWEWPDQEKYRTLQCHYQRGYIWGEKMLNFLKIIKTNSYDVYIKLFNKL